MERKLTMLIRKCCSDCMCLRQAIFWLIRYFVNHNFALWSHTYVKPRNFVLYDCSLLDTKCLHRISQPENVGQFIPSMYSYFLNPYFDLVSLRQQLMSVCLAKHALILLIYLYCSVTYNVHQAVTVTLCQRGFMLFKCLYSINLGVVTSVEWGIVMKLI